MKNSPFVVVAVDPLPSNFSKLLGENFPAPSFEFRCPENARDELLEALLPGARVLLTRKRRVNEALLELSGDDLKLVQVMGREPDRVDLEAARARGIAVATMPHGGAQAVAEHAFCLMSALSRQLIRGHRGVQEGDYRQRNLTPEETSESRFAFNWLGFDDVSELRDKTLGLIGFGEIGKELARRARAFEMKILYNQRSRLDEDFERRLEVAWRPLDDLLREADFVSLHAPHTAETDSLLDRRRLGLMKNTAYLINTARGGLVEEAALVEALREGRIAGAGLDVFALEPLPAEHPLTRLDNVILAPHTGGGSGGGQKKHFEEVAKNVSRITRGLPPLNLVS